MRAFVPRLALLLVMALCPVAARADFTPGPMLAEGIYRLALLAIVWLHALLVFFTLFLMPVRSSLYRTFVSKIGVALYLIFCIYEVYYYREYSSGSDKQLAGLFFDSIKFYVVPAIGCTISVFTLLRKSSRP